MADFCDDNRFELIEKYKQKLIEETNIESAPDEMKVLDDIMFRIWQMGWLDKLEQQTAQQWIPCKVRLPEESGTYIVTAYDGVNNKRVSFVKYQKTLKRWDLTGARAYWSILAYKPLPEPWKGEQE